MFHASSGHFRCGTYLVLVAPQRMMRRSLLLYMPRLRQLQCLTRFIILFLLLAVRTTCLPRSRTAGITGSYPTSVIVVDPLQTGHYDTGVRHPSTQGFEVVSGEHVAAGTTELRRRSLGFQHFLSIGNGWNMYYSSWPVVALPVRKWKFEQ